MKVFLTKSTSIALNAQRSSVIFLSIWSMFPRTKAIYFFPSSTPEPVTPFLFYKKENNKDELDYLYWYSLTFFIVKFFTYFIKFWQCSPSFQEIRPSWFLRRTFQASLKLYLRRKAVFVLDQPSCLTTFFRLNRQS